MRKIFFLFSLIVFSAGLFVFTGSAQKPIKDQRPTNWVEDIVDIEPATSFEVTYITSIVTPAGEVKNKGVRTRLVRASGEWKELFHNSGAITASLPDGVWRIDPGSNLRESAGGPVDPEMVKGFRSKKWLERSPNLVRIENVAGLDCYVFRTEANSGGMLIWVEQCYSPKTGYTPLKTVLKEKDGSESRREAVKIDFREVSSFEDLKALPAKQ